MIPPLVRHETQVLLHAGHTQADVARRVGRPSEAATLTERVRGWLAKDAGLPTQALLWRAKDAGDRGGKLALYGLVAGLRPPRVTPVVQFEGLPGENSQHDFGEVAVAFLDGRKRRVHFFASRPRRSRCVSVTLVEPERVETIVRGALPAPRRSRIASDSWFRRTATPAGARRRYPRSSPSRAPRFL